jgi:hypothetical protein
MVTIENEKQPYVIMVRDDCRRKLMVQVPVGSRAAVLADDAESEGLDRGVRIAIGDGSGREEGRVARRYLSHSPRD